MTQTHIALSATPDSRSAGLELGQEIRAAFGGDPPDAVVVFASARHDYAALLGALADAAGTEVITGASSAGEFTHDSQAEGQVSALALRTPEMRLRVALARGVSGGAEAAAARLVQGFHGAANAEMPYRSALVMTDALAGHADALVDQLTRLTGGNYRFFGGGAGDDGRFQATHVFAGREACTDAVAALEIQSLKPVGIGVAHGWEPAGPGLRVTEAAGSRIAGLNGAPAADAFQAFASATGQAFNPADPLPFFLHNVLGIRGEDGYHLRVPLAVDDSGAVLCAAAVPQGAVVHIMRTSANSAVQAARQAAAAALQALGGHPPAAAFVFDCVATRLRLGQAFQNELQACADLLQPAGYVGCNTYGQIARAEGQFSGFHNCTAVVCVLPS